MYTVDLFAETWEISPEWVEDLAGAVRISPPPKGKMVVSEFRISLVEYIDVYKYYHPSTIPYMFYKKCVESAINKLLREEWVPIEECFHTFLLLHKTEKCDIIFGRQEDGLYTIYRVIVMTL